MRTSTRTWATALGISAALTVAGCSGSDSDGQEKKQNADSGRELFLQPVAAQGPDPFTDSTARDTGSPPPVTRSQQPSPSDSSPPADQGLRSLAGGTPGLYGGTQRVGSCDVGLQIRFLTAEPARARAFAGAAGIAQDGIPAYLRGLTPVVLRADTRVTNHGYRDGRATAYQSVLQAGTAVLVDDRGLPRVRCACGNPLKPPVAFRNTPSHSGQPWSGYRPTKVIVVTPAPRPINVIVIVNIVNNTWIERKTGDHHGEDDHTVPPPDPTSTPPTDSADPDESGDPSDSTDPTDPSDSADPFDSSDPSDPADPSDPSSPSDRDLVPGTPDEDGTPTDCPTPGTGTDDPLDATPAPAPVPPGCPTPPQDPGVQPPGPQDRTPDGVTSTVFGPDPGSFDS
ncbi:DUF6777 domain-containing protein [Streptomyces aureoverticillatus]|uniref:DUF6777 domain-containing protein n=1 Tax=Streptomyces aureoverticillatus TaxID=66871 RepID=UPI0013DA29E9|nr:DUF6777 domain-containing protein [Streptomyces aureoverticillatus]QIB42263.1 hypothetical protein G3H79_03380 [Streptomyces aureoverticillatus]